MSASLACADAGARVVLLEAAARLGGLTSSVRREGIVVDLGQHVFLRCCSAYRSLLDRIGATGMTVLQERLDIPVLRAGAPAVHLRRAVLPAPFHLAWTLATYPLVSPQQRLVAARAAWRLKRMSLSDCSLDASSFGSWLASQGVSQRAIESFWDLFVLATLNVPAAEASLALALKVFRTGLLERAAAADIGVHCAPLSDVLGGPTERSLRRIGADVRLRTMVRAVVPSTDGTLSVAAGGDQLRADAVVLAVPHDRVTQLLPSQAGLDRDSYSRLGSTAIVNAHLFFDRPVMGVPFAAALNAPVQWVFDRTAATGLGRGQYLAVSISAADAIVDLPLSRLREQVLNSLVALLPAVRGAVLERFLATRIRQATFRQAPGSAAMRPGPRTKVANLFLAGAWTDTGWSATMEGAVRSGRSAAACALAAVGMQSQSLGVVI